jgi:erythronate-4-phosphate dehydrogenase
MQAEFVTLHVPLTREGPDPTFRLFDLSRMEAMKEKSVLLNTSRGPVVESRALALLLDSGHLSAAVLDVWEDEPTIDPALLERVALGTAHISGYSLDGKVNAVRMVYESLCRHRGVERAWAPPPLPRPLSERIDLTDRAEAGEETLRQVVTQCYDIERDDAQLRPIAAVPADERGAFFRRLRKEYPLRREFSATTVRCRPDDAFLSRTLQGLGFTVTY